MSSPASLRIVSLVPSITELVCDLGLANHLVGRTGFCIHPRDQVRGIPKVGGTKDIKLARIRALAPTHVIVNVEENRREHYDALREFVPEIIVTYPQAPEDNLALYTDLGARFNRAAQAEDLAARFNAALAAARDRTAALPSESVLYLIWRDPWMTVSADTYIARTLATVGWRTVPTAPGARYPEIDLIDAARDADRILLSSEPYRFGAADAEEITRLTGTPTQLIDGEMTSWYGSRAIAGLGYLAGLR